MNVMPLEATLTSHVLISSVANKNIAEASIYIKIVFVSCGTLNRKNGGCMRFAFSFPFEGDNR
jgi:hypothetical protein